MKRFLTIVVLVMCVVMSLFAGGQKESANVKFLYFTLPRETQVILEMEKMLVEKYTDYTVELQNVDQVSLGWAVLESSKADAYMEYTGTAYTTILQQVITDEVLEPAVMKVEVQKLLNNRGYKLLGNLGFQNTYAFAVTKATAEKYGLKKISDLKDLAPNMIFASNADFLNRDGVLSYKTTVDKYGLKFKDAISMDAGLMYQAINKDEIQVALAYTTDGVLVDQGLVCLEDDLHVFPPYDACVLIRKDTLDKYPGLEDALNKLEGQVTAEEMQMMNYRITADEISDHDMAIEFLKSKGLI